MWDYRAKLVRVKDGDTQVYLLDKGHRESLEIDGRLLGVFAPDRNDAGYKECTDFAKEWFNINDRGLEWPYVVTFSRIKDGSHELLTLGRYVCVVTSIVSSANLNLEMQSFIARNGYPGGIGS
jgi:hypothetical protein